MKKLLYLLILVLFAGAATSCKDDDKIYHPKTEDVPLIIPKIDLARDSFNINNPAAEFSFFIELDNRGVDVQSVEIYKTYNGNSIFTPAVLHTTLTSFPATVTMDLNQALQGFTVPDGAGGNDPVELADVEKGDVIIFTYEIVRSDGRRIVYTPVNAGGFIQGVSTIFEPLAIWAPIKGF